MSLTNVLKRPADASVRQATPGQNFGSNVSMGVDGSGSAGRRIFIYFAGLPDPGATIISATLDLYLRNAWSGGPHVVTFERILATWKEDKINWNNQPAISATNAATASITGGTDKQKVSVDVTQLVRDMLAAALPYGLRLRLSTTGVKAFYSGEANDRDLRPVLTVVWSSPPGAPTGLVPGGGQLVNKGAPVLSWSFVDADGDDQGQYRVKIDDTADMSSPVYDSGWVVGSEQSLDLSLTAYVANADGTTRYWTVQCRDTDGNDGVVSDIASWTRDVKGTLALTSPGATTETMRPTVSWTLTGETQAAYRWTLSERRANGVGWSDIAGSPGTTMVVSAANSFKLPGGLITRKNRDYRLILEVLDNKTERVATPGDPVEYRVTQIFQHVDPVTNPGSPTSIVVTQNGPGVLISWTRGTVPDYWALRVDGRYIFDDIDGVDLSTGGTSYAYSWFGAKAGVSQTYEVVAVVTVSGDDKPSKSNPTQVYISRPIGAWLVDREENPIQMIQIVGVGGDAEPSFSLGEEGAWFYAVGRSAPIRITDTVRGNEGSVSGHLQNRWEYLLLMEMKQRATDGRKVWFVGGPFSFRVQLGEISVNPVPMSNEVFEVDIEMAQVADWDVEL